MYENLKDPIETPAESIKQILDEWFKEADISDSTKTNMANFIAKGLKEKGYVIQTEWQNVYYQFH